MRNRIKRWLIVMLVGVLMFHQISDPFILSASTGIETEAAYPNSDEKEIMAEATTDDKIPEGKNQEKALEENQDGEESSDDIQNFDKRIEELNEDENQQVEGGTEVKNETEAKNEDDKSAPPEQEEVKQDDTVSKSDAKKERAISDNKTKTLRMAEAVTYANNSINMPKATYKTMILQGAKGQGQRIAESGKVTMMASDGDIQRDIDANHKEYSSFTPHFSSSTTAILSTRNGSKSIRTYLDDPDKAALSGVFGKPVNENCAVDGRVFNLTADMKNQLSCTYTNVGRYYDRTAGRSYAIDMKAVLVDYTAKSKASANVKNAIEAGVLGEEGGAMFAFVGNVGIGVLVSFCDSVTIKYYYYIHGTQTPISVKGFTQFRDVDAQQGIEFSSQADYFYAVNTENQFLGCSKGVYSAGNKAYIYALSCQEVSNQTNHRFYSLFSGTELSLRFTFAKCSRNDDGGAKNGSDLEQYEVPYDPALVKPYSSTASGGYMAFTAKSAALSRPEIEKTVFNGDNIAGEVSAPHKELTNTLADVTSEFTYKIRTVCPYADASEHRYGSWVLKDQVSPYLNVKKVVAYDGTGNQSDAFQFQTAVQGDGSTIVTATAKNTADQSFYEKNWYDLYITVQVKSLAELEKYHLNFSDLYVKSGTNRGKYVIKNNASLSTGTTYTSNETETIVPQWVQVKKVNEQGKPIKGVTFGIYSSSGADVAKDTPLMKAETGQDGIAQFKMLTFFELAGKDGPYYIKEISRGSFDNVYQLENQWYYEFSASKGNGVIYGELNSSSAILKDRSKILEKQTLIVRKKNKETSNYLLGAVFTLYQWSQTSGSYMKLGDLVQNKDEKGYYYTNDRSFTATEDNLGRFMVKETKAPYGCYYTQQEWCFETTDQYIANPEALEFTYQNQNGTVVTQKGELIYQNRLQKGQLTIIKTDEEKNLVPGAVFGVWATEDIYAPWQCDEKGEPLEGEEPLVAKDSLCDKITTDENGTGTSELLYIGNYQIAEMEGAPNHVRSDQVYEVSFEYPSDDRVKIVSRKLEVGNLVMRPSMAVSKIADRTRNEEGEEVAFQKETGRFTEEKIAGCYNAGEQIRYEITVTNTGNVDLYHLRLMDDMTRLNDAGQKLEDYVEKESASFVIPSDQKYTSSLGNPVSCSLLGENGSCMILNKLAVGDSVTVFFEVTVSADAANVYRLRNLVSVTASYDNNEDVSSQKLIPVNTEEMVDENGNLLTEDEDSVHIPGVSNQNVVKTADRTSGCIITDGILNGTKVPGIYHAEEEVIFSITIKNSGTANLKKILVTDILSEELRNVIDIDTATFRLETVGGFLMTEQGRQIDAKLIDNTHVMLCENTDPVTGEGMLLPDDMVSLEFHCTLKQDVANLYDLENKVMIHSFYYDGQKDQEVAPVEDADMIEVPGIPEAKLAKLADRTTGTVLVEGRYEKRKIPGSYKNLEQVTYLITITNSGTTDLYDLKVRDVMEERLLDAFKKGSVSFQYGSYQTKKEDTIAATKVDAENTGNQFCIRLNRLKAGDSVELCLSGTVNEKAGELSELENKAYVTAHYKKGNEEALKDYEKIVEESGITYALLYHANNGTAETTTDSETPVVAGKKVTVNGNPFYKEGYVFLGWNTREDGSGEDYAPGATLSMPSQDVHLYAQWDKSGSILKKQYEYSLVYHSNNKKKQEQPDSETRCLAGTILTLDANMFIHEGYRFLGWSLIPNEKDSLLQPDSSYQMPKKDVHLYAQWEKVKTVTLTYHSNYKNDIPGEESLEETRKDFETPCQTGTEITVKQCDFEREDYTFEGWSLRSNAQNGDMKPDQNMILNEDTDLYAVWKPKASGADQFRYKLTYHGNNETMDAYVDSETPCVKGKDILLDSNRFTYDGYEFAGWNTKSDGTGKQLENSTSFSMPERNVHLYAIWVKKEKCRLTYQSNYPAASGKTNQEEKTDCETPCLPQTEVTLDGNRFQCDGHAFLGWSIHPDNSNETAGLLLPEETFTLTEDTILYAIWTNQIEEYSLLYSSNTETPIWETDPYSPSPAGTPRKLIQNPFPNKSQSFVGWSLKPDAGDDSKDILHPGDRFEQPNRNVILYAIWKEEEGVTLQYDANGGTIKTSAEQSESDQESGNTTQNNRVQDEETPCVPNDTIRIDANPFAKKGYHFLGWSKKPTVLSKADTSVELIYPGCEYTMPDKNIILYAVWEKNTQHTFDDDPVSESPYTPIAVTELMKDDDRINIPGIPILSVAKMADRTKGIQLKNGRYEGKRKPGTYYKDETVTCKITVSNSGTAAALDLKINEQPSQSWKKVLQPAGYTVSMGENITTAMGKTICVLSKTTNQVTLDRLDPGDQVTLYYEAIVKETKVTEKTLKNTVEVSGKSNDGTTIPKTHLMTDSDNIKIGNKDKQPEKNKIISQHPKTGDKTPLVPLSILTIGMFLTAIIIFIINKKKITPNKR